jgi:hypothetical protein
MLRAAGLAAFAAFLFASPGARADDARRKQEIEMGELPARAVGDAPFEIAASATSGLPVTFEVISGPAAWDGKKIKLTGPGLVVVRATQAGNGVFLPAVPAERAFAVAGRPSAPAFTLQPMSVGAAVGDPVVLAVQASGEPLPDYQWRKEGVAIAGANQRTLAISAATPADAGNYDAVATNALGSATSVRARVSIGRRMQSISFQSPSASISGQPVLLAATASSGLPVQFQLISGTATLNGSTLIPQSGPVVIQASQDGDATFEAAAPVMQTLQVTPNPTGQRFP